MYRLGRKWPSSLEEVQGKGKAAETCLDLCSLQGETAALPASHRGGLDPKSSRVRWRNNVACVSCKMKWGSTVIQCRWKSSGKGSWSPGVEWLMHCVSWGVRKLGSVQWGPHLVNTFQGLRSGMHAAPTLGGRLEC